MKEIKDNLDGLRVYPQIRNLAFYKRSGEPWTQEEYANICEYVGDENDSGGAIGPKAKYVFDDGKSCTVAMFMWSKQEEHPNFKNCKQVAYEDVFPSPIEGISDIASVVNDEQFNGDEDASGCHNSRDGVLFREHKDTAPYQRCVFEYASNEKNDDPIEPSHYTEMKVSPLEYITANEGEFTWCIANVIKYVSRYRRKNGTEDLKKARWYLDHQIKMLEEQ